MTWKGSFLGDCFDVDRGNRSAERRTDQPVQSREARWTFIVLNCV
jgi:hypothetical protein